MVDLNKTTSIIILNVSYINATIKRYILSNWINKHELKIKTLDLDDDYKKPSLSIKNIHWLKTKVWKRYVMQKMECLYQ